MNSFEVKKVKQKAATIALMCLLVFIGYSLHESEISTLALHVDRNAVSRNLGMMERQAKCEVKPLTNISDFFDYFQKELYPCEKKEKVGGKIYRKAEDGEKWICFDEGVAPSTSNCLVYSFGINNEWSFDDAMAKRGCKVYSFDPTMETPDHQRSENVTFFQLGISNRDGFQRIAKAERKVAHLLTIMDQLGHTGRQLDYLKMDIEGMEVDVFEDLLARHPGIMALVKQIGFEIHPGIYRGQDVTNPRNPFHRLWKIYQLLECQGFRLFHWNMNAVVTNHYMWRKTRRSACYELAYVRISD